MAFSPFMSGGGGGTIDASQIISGTVNPARIGETKTVSANYTVTTSDDVIFVNSLLGPITITLPDPNASEQKFTVADIGNAEVNPITIVAPPGLIEGAASFQIDIQFASYTFAADGGDYRII